MQRIVTIALVVVLLATIALNAVLVVQTRQLRGQLADAQTALSAASAKADQTKQLAELQDKLDRSEKDRIKAARDSAALRDQLGQLQNAAQERDTLKGQVQTLQQENQQLRNQVGNLQAMNEISGQVAALRDLTPLSNVPREFMNRRQLRDYFTQQFAKEETPEAEQRQLAALQALDMDRGTTNLRQAQIDDLVKNVLGFYNQETKRLVVVTERATLGVSDRITYAHEFTHNLQDQHYNLTELFKRTDGNADSQMALKALVEGDATLTMGLYARAHLSAMDIVNYRIEQVQQLDLSGYFSGQGGPLVESAAQFPYTDGATFVDALYEAGGWQLVDRAFKNPPRSTEQILHVEKYVAGEGPVAVQLPNLQQALGSTWKLMDEDTLGELYMRIYLEHNLPFEQAIPAAEGWGGDRYQVLRDDGGELALALQTVWDSPEQAREFFTAYSSYTNAKGKGATAQQLGPNRLRWDLTQAGQQIFVSLRGNQVLVLRASYGATLDKLIAQFPGF